MVNRMVSKVVGGEKRFFLFFLADTSQGKLSVLEKQGSRKTTSL